MSDIIRFDLPATRDGREQWAMIERQPDRAQLKEIERRGRQALRSDVAMDGEDWIIVTLVTEWQVYDKNGEQVPLRTGKAMDAIPAAVLSPLIDELTGIIESTNRGRAMAQVGAALRNMALTLDTEKAQRVDDLLAELHSLFGVTDPNA